MSRRSLNNISRLLDIDTSPVEEQFLEDLKRSIEITDGSHRRLPSKTFKPSSMQCPRNSYYQLIGAEPDEQSSSYNFVGICNSGSDIHERVQKSISVMHDNGMPCEWKNVGEYVKQKDLSDLVVRKQTGFETKLFNKRYNISFMCDGLILYKNKYYIIEIKTEMSSKWYTRTGVDTKHYNQAIAYSLSLKLDNVIFIYVNRDTLDMKSYMFRVSDEDRQKLVDYMVDVDRHVSIMSPPPKKEGLPRAICSYCAYKTVCKGDN